MGSLPMSKIVNPLLFSGLALAGANNWTEPQLLPEEVEDGLLTAEVIIFYTHFYVHTPMFQGFFSTF